MEENTAILGITKMILFWISPVIFLFGIVLILYSNYRKLEDFLGEEVGGIKKRIILAIETNIYTFHEWLMERRTLLGFVCIVFSIIIFFVFGR